MLRGSWGDKNVSPRITRITRIKDKKEHIDFYLLSFIRVIRVIRGETVIQRDSDDEPVNPAIRCICCCCWPACCLSSHALAYAVVPTLEQKARDAGQPPPPSEFRDALRKDGWRWLLYEVGAVVVLSVASMTVDRLRTLQKQRGEATIPPMTRGKTIPLALVCHVETRATRRRITPPPRSSQLSLLRRGSARNLR